MLPRARSTVASQGIGRARCEPIANRASTGVRLAASRHHTRSYLPKKGMGEPQRLFTPERTFKSTRAPVPALAHELVTKSPEAERQVRGRRQRGRRHAEPRETLGHRSCVGGVEGVKHIGRVAMRESVDPMRAAWVRGAPRMQIVPDEGAIRGNQRQSMAAMHPNRTTLHPSAMATTLAPRRASPARRRRLRPQTPTQVPLRLELPRTQAREWRQPHLMRLKASQP